MHLDIVSAEEEIFSGNVKNIVAAAMMGEVGIYPKHTPMITPLKPGEIKIITEEDEEQLFFVSGGVLEVQPNIVTILADTAIRGEDLDEAKAAESKKRAEEALADKSDNIFHMPGLWKKIKGLDLGNLISTMSSAICRVTK